MTRMLIVSLALFLFYQTARAADEIETAKARLKSQLNSIAKIEPYVERQDLPRLFFLRSSVASVLKATETHGLAHKVTFQEFQKLIVAFRFSVAFLRQIETEDTKEACESLLKVNEEIATAHGFDDSPYTQITLSVFTQMDKLTDELKQLAIADELKVKLADLKPTLGEVLAVTRAKGGDRRTVYPVAKKAFDAITELYPDFHEISMSESAFEITLEIQGLNEFYGEFAEFDNKD